LQLLRIEIERQNLALLITSGASSVGSNAIQLAHAAGYDIFTTASPNNFELVHRLGAEEVVDYHDQDVAEKLAKV
jgi:NADPH:quinone reductase-like Zn-dependent oxidoreductase